MKTVIVSGDGRTWDEILGFNSVEDEGKLKLAQKALQLVLNALRQGMWENPGRNVGVGNAKSLYGKLIWDIIQEPTFAPRNIGDELGQLYLAYALRKIIESNPRIYQTKD